MTEVLKGGRRRRLGFRGAQFSETRIEPYQVFADDYQVINDEDVRLEFVRSFVERGSALGAVPNTHSYSIKMLPDESRFLHPNYPVHHVHWDTSEWLTDWVNQVTFEETPEDFHLPPMSERRATGKVRKYYEPASFRFVEDEVSTEDTED